MLSDVCKDFQKVAGARLKLTKSFLKSLFKKLSFLKSKLEIFLKSLPEKQLMLIPI